MITKKVAFEMDVESNELINDLVYLTGITKAELLNMAVSEFTKKFMKDNQLEEQVKELQSFRSKKSKK